jgi:hypothetical protein
MVECKYWELGWSFCDSPGSSWPWEQSQVGGGKLLSLSDSPHWLQMHPQGSPSDDGWQEPSVLTLPIERLGEVASDSCCCSPKLASLFQANDMVWECHFWEWGQQKEHCESQSGFPAPELTRWELTSDLWRWLFTESWKALLVGQLRKTQSPGLQMRVNWAPGSSDIYIYVYQGALCYSPNQLY